MNTILRPTLITLFLSFALAACTSPYKRSVIHPARPGDLSYRELMLKDFEQMQAAMRKYVRHAKQDFSQADEDPQAEASAFLQLKRALRLIFSRPDSDNVVAKLVPEVRRELSLYDAYPTVIHEIAQEGVQAFDPSLGVNTVTLATYSFMLQNLLGEIKAEAQTNQALLKTIDFIAQSDLKIPYDVIQERKLSGMFLSESPSSQAKRISESIKASQKKTP